MTYIIITIIVLENKKSEKVLKSGKLLSFLFQNNTFTLLYKDKINDSKFTHLLSFFKTPKQKNTTTTPKHQK